MPHTPHKDIIRIAFAGIFVAGVGAVMAPTHTIGVRGAILRGLVGRYAPSQVIVVSGPAVTTFTGPTSWGHKSLYTMRTVDTQNNPYGTGDTYESFSNVVGVGTQPNGSGGPQHWSSASRQPSPYNFNDNLGVKASGPPAAGTDPLLLSYDQLWHNSDKTPDDSLNTNHDQVYYYHSVRG